MSTGDELKELVLKRTGLTAGEDELECPNERSGMTPCVARDGDCAMTNDGCCVGCGVPVKELLEAEKRKAKPEPGNWSEADFLNAYLDNWETLLDIGRTMAGTTVQRVQAAMVAGATYVLDPDRLVRLRTIIDDLKAQVDVLEALGPSKDREL